MCVFAGWTLSSRAIERAAFVGVPIDTKKPLVCEGLVRGDPVVKDWGMQFVLDLQSCGGASARETLGTVLVNAGRAFVPVTPASGATVRAPLVFTRPREFNNPGGFSYGRYLLIRGIGATASARGRVETIRPSASAFNRLLSTWRARLKQAIYASASPASAGVLTALATGDRTGIEEEVRKSFSHSGLSHLLAISGLHVGYVSLLIFFLLRCFLRVCPVIIERVPLAKLAAGLSLPILWMYIAFVGYPLSAMRAGLMLTVYLSGVIFGMRQDGLTSLAAAVVIVLLVMPLAVLDVSFQLSVAAVVGIILLGGPLAASVIAWTQRAPMGRVLKYAGSLFAMSIAAALFTAPLVAHSFGTFTALGPAANLIAVPLMAMGIMPLVLAASFLTALSSWLASFAWQGAGAFVQALIVLSERAQEIGASLSGGWFPSSLEMLLAYAAIGLLVSGWRGFRVRGLVITAALSAAICVDAMALNVMPLLSQKLSVTFFDVGQGDSALVRFPRGATMLIDGGGLKGSSIDVGESVLTPALRALGVKHIDWIVVTHPHFDHFGGLEQVVGAFDIGEVFINGQAPEEEEAELWESFLIASRNAGVRMTVIGGVKHRIESGGAVVEIMPSPLVHTEGLNNTSLAIRVFYRDNSFLFTGDLEAPGERAFMASGVKTDADVLQVGHHGSRDASSEAFLAAVTPEIAVISVGRGNRYGLPNAKALTRIGTVADSIYRTDEQGAIIISTDGEKLDVETWNDGHEM